MFTSFPEQPVLRGIVKNIEWHLKMNASYEVPSVIPHGSLWRPDSATSTKPHSAAAKGNALTRRNFLKSSALALAASTLSGFTTFAAESKPYRVGLIGTGWYGKSNLFRLIQVAPVEVVSLCDVDKKLLAGAAEMVSQRQKSKKVPRTYSDYRDMLKEKDLDIVLIGTPDHWHATRSRVSLLTTRKLRHCSNGRIGPGGNTRRQRCKTAGLLF